MTSVKLIIQNLLSTNVDTFLTLRNCRKSSYESFRIAAIDDAGLTLKQSTHDIQEGANDEPNMVRQEYEDLEILLAGREAETTSKAKAGSCALVPGQGLQTPHSSNSTPICSFCSRDHYLLRCPDYIVLDVRLGFNHVCERKLVSIVFWLVIKLEIANSDQIFFEDLKVASTNITDWSIIIWRLDYVPLKFDEST